MTASRIGLALRRWVDSGAVPDAAADARPRRVDWPRVAPFVAVHLGCLGVIWTGTSTTAIAVAVSLYLLRMFAITAFYHRYFSHRAFQTSRAAQFAFALLGAFAHRFGSRRYATRDDSRNNPWLALVTLGEGWHNNHHRYPAAARQGFYWWELDVSWYGLRLLAWLGIVRELRPVPAAIRESHRGRHS